jgi:hypothetical protein
VDEDQHAQTAGRGLHRDVREDQRLPAAGRQLVERRFLAAPVGVAQRVDAAGLILPEGEAYRRTAARLRASVRRFSTDAGRFAAAAS